MTATEKTQATEGAEANGQAAEAGSKAERRARRLAKQANAQEEANNAAAAQAATRKVNAVPKPGARKAKATQTTIEGEQVETAAAKRKREADEKRAQRDADKLAKAKEREDAKAKRDQAAKERADARAAKEQEKTAAAEAEARIPRILAESAFPRRDQMVPIGMLVGRPELVGARPGADLVESIRRRGVLENVTLVQPEGTNEFRIAGGRRRIMGAILVEAKEVPATVYTVPVADADTLQSGLTIHLHGTRSENIAAEVQAVGRLRNTHTVEQISKQLGMPFGTVKKRIKLLDLLPEVQELLFSGKVAHSVIGEMSGLSEEDQRSLVERFNQTGKLSHKDVAAVRKARGGEGGLDLDEATEGATREAAEGRTSPINPDVRLDTGILALLKRAAQSSGVGFEVQGGTITFTRNGETVIFDAAYDAGTPDEGGEGETPSASQTPDEGEGDETPAPVAPASPAGEGESWLADVEDNMEITREPVEGEAGTENPDEGFAQDFDPA